ncbi:hypothetical protein BDV26DRAFT_275884 [Aspergillus bertholletiae]|uniref:Uncharacterized protein n=1 Tax=Aspergillus bertholletiae TaxID=1226010 RepID=A0A5N7ANW0_9EURO|nr:hypothetical protein BDV26DRAFT_275884 [Aspergillus bertholletiae]
MVHLWMNARVETSVSTLSLFSWQGCLYHSRGPSTFLWLNLKGCGARFQLVAPP